MEVCTTPLPYPKYLKSCLEFDSKIVVGRGGSKLWSIAVTQHLEEVGRSHGTRIDTTPLPVLD